MVGSVAAWSAAEQCWRLVCCQLPGLEGCAASPVVCRLAWSISEVVLPAAVRDGLLRSARMRSVQLTDLQ